MKSKITLLIVASVAGLISLFLVQMHLIQNTYQLKKEAFIQNTSESVSSIDDSFTRVDSLRSVWRDHIVEIATGFQQGEFAREEILERFQVKTTQLNPAFQTIVQESLDKIDAPSSLKFQKRVRSIVVQGSVKNDTIFSITNDHGSYILGDTFEGKEYKLGESTSLSEYTSSKIVDGVETFKIIRLNFETETIMNFEGWEQQILLQIRGLLIISAGIFLFVFGVLFYSIKNLITQKKIADVKTDFINNISHEFKTPLTTLSVASGMLKKEPVNPENLTSTIAIIERQNQKLQKLLDQVLNNSLSYSEIQLEIEEVPIEAFLSSLLDDFELAMQHAKIKLIRDFNVGQYLASFDKFFLSTAILNMLENAVKYNSEEVILSIEADVNDMLSIRIKDNGMGITEKDQNSLFEKFYRVVKDDTHEVKGLGLGLYYANQIIKAHQGKIGVSSKIGVGSVFTIELPMNKKASS